MLVELRSTDTPRQPNADFGTRHPGPDAIVRGQQRRRLERGHKHHPPVVRGERFGPLGGGTWVRHGSKRARGDLDGWRLIDAVEWMADRRFLEWTAADQSVLDELDVRCFKFADIARRMVLSRPCWLDGLVREQWGVDGPGFPRSGGFLRFIADLVHARRSHAVGLLISQPDAATLYDVSDRQFRRWIVRAEAMKLVRVVQTWCEDRYRSGKWRCWGKTLYMLGSAVIERAGAALYEGLELQLPDGRSMAPVAAHKGRELRRARRTEMRDRHDAVWRSAQISARDRVIERNTRRSPSFNSLDMVSRSARRNVRQGGAELQTPPEISKRSEPTSPDTWKSSPRTGGRVGPPGRISASPLAPRSGAPTTDRQKIGSSEKTKLRTSVSSGPQRGCVGRDRRGAAADEPTFTSFGADVERMIAERMRNGFGGALLGLLFLFFFASNPSHAALNAQNKVEYAKQEHTTTEQPHSTGLSRSGPRPHAQHRGVEAHKRPFPHAFDDGWRSNRRGRRRPERDSTAYHGPHRTVFDARKRHREDHDARQRAARRSGQSAGAVRRREG